MSKADRVLKALAKGTEEVRKNPSEANYRYWENRIDNLGRNNYWKWSVGIILGVSFIFMVFSGNKNSSTQPKGTSNPQNKPSNSFQINERQAPINVIRKYYDALDKRDANSAIALWKNQDSWRKRKLRQLIKWIEWFTINDIKLTRFSSTFARIWVDVTGKQKKEYSERWIGTIELNKINGYWVISKMKLRKK